MKIHREIPWKAEFDRTLNKGPITQLVSKVAEKAKECIEAFQSAYKQCKGTKGTLSAKEIYNAISHHLSLIETIHSLPLDDVRSLLKRLNVEDKTTHALRSMLLACPQYKSYSKFKAQSQRVLPLLQRDRDDELMEYHELQDLHRAGKLNKDGINRLGNLENSINDKQDRIRFHKS
jgi:hypothetical protein